MLKHFINAQLTSYPYKNPTSTNISEACEIITTPGTLGGGDAVEYTLSNGDMLLPDGGYMMLHWPVSSRVRVFLYDQNDEVITFDDVYNSGSSRYFKILRGMHSVTPSQEINRCANWRTICENSSYIFAYSPNADSKRNC